MRPLSARERRLIAIGLLLVVAALLWSITLAPLLDGFTARTEERALLRDEYARNSRLIGAIPSLRRQAERQQADDAKLAILAPTPAVARATLRDRLQRQLVAAGGTVTALQDVPTPPGQARAWVQGRMSIPQLNAFLLTATNSQPYLVIESLRISADRVLETGRTDQLEIRLEASIPHLGPARG